MLDIIAGCLLFGSFAIVFTFAAIEGIRQLVAGYKVAESMQGEDWRESWNAQIDSTWSITLGYAVMAVIVWGLIVWGLVKEFSS